MRTHVALASTELAGNGLTPSQHERRERMLAATAQLAAEGGWDAVQMREVAQRSDVALGTLYRYFPSKEYLLVSVMISDIEGLADLLAIRPPEGGDPVDRVVDVLRRANKALLRQEQVTVAMIRALVSGNDEIAPVVKQTRGLMRRIIGDALEAGTGVAGDDGEIRIGEADLMRMDLLSDVWFASLVSWISGVEDAEDLVPKLERATRELLA